MWRCRYIDVIAILVVVVLPDTFRGMEGWGRGGTPRRPNSRATPQGLDQRSKIEVVPQRLAASTWWCGPRPSIREGRNGETTNPRDPTIRSPPNRLIAIFVSKFNWRIMYAEQELTAPGRFSIWPDLCCDGRKASECDEENNSNRNVINPNFLKYSKERRGSVGFLLKKKTHH